MRATVNTALWILGIVSILCALFPPYMEIDPGDALGASTWYSVGYAPLWAPPEGTSININRYRMAIQWTVIGALVFAALAVKPKAKPRK